MTRKLPYIALLVGCVILLPGAFALLLWSLQTAVVETGSSFGVIATHTYRVLGGLFGTGACIMGACWAFEKLDKA